MQKRFFPFVLFLAFSKLAFGQVWESKAVGLLPSKFSVADICIVNEQVIWAVAFDWTPVYNGGPVPATAIAKLLKTTDGGQNWTVKDIEEAQGRIVYDIHAFDENTACITSQDLGSGPGKGIFRTTDGGENWTETFHHVAGGGTIYFFDGQEGVCQNQNLVARTTDGGANWASVSNVPNLLANEFQTFSSASNALGTFGDMVYFGTTKGRLFKTEDRGKTWKATATGLGSQSTLQALGFMDEKNGLAVSWNNVVGGKKELVRSTDGGLTWAHTGYFGFEEVDVVPCSKTFMAVQYWSDQRTAISSDFGQTWTLVDSTIDAAGAVFKTPELGWMIEAKEAGVGTGPALYKWVGGSLDTRIYVNQFASGANNGRGWADAFTDLKTALAAAKSGDEIWVAEGIYQPAWAHGLQSSSFLIDKNLKLYGGFAGTECLLSERNPELHPTVLSGDLNHNDLPNDLSSFRGDNAYHVVQIAANVTNATLLDGFTIRSGNAVGTASNDDRRGGGLLCLGKPTIRQCVFELNFAERNGGGIAMNSTSGGFALDGCTFHHNSGNEGGGMVITSNQFTVEHCTFIGNATHSGALEAHGGGIFLTNPNPGTIHDCHFSENTSVETAAGLFAWTNTGSTQSSLSVSDCTFENNTAQSVGAGIEFAPWGDNSKFSISNCHFQNNEASNGAGLNVYVNSNANNTNISLRDCSFSKNHGDNDAAISGQNSGTNTNIDLNTCQFTQNTASSEAGGMSFYATEVGSGTLTIDSCRFENNSALVAGGVELGVWNSAVAQMNYILTNDTIQNNHAGAYGAGGALFWGDVGGKANFLVENCLVRGNTSAGKAGGIGFNVYSKDFHATVKRTRIEGNQAQLAGGAVAAFHIFPDVPFPTTASVVFENCLLAGNTSTGATVTADSLPNLHFLHCTIAGNTGSGGIALADKSGLTLQNTILSDNGPGSPQLTASANSQFGSFGGNLLGDASLGSKATPYDFQNADPLFAAPGDFHLAAASPAIDKGVGIGSLPATDLDGNPRVVGCPDIGAFENAVVVSSDCVMGAGEAAVAGSLGISPNPAGDFLKIELPENVAAQPLAASVFDVAGKLVLEKRLAAAGQTLDLTGLPPGVFALKVVAGERVFAGKFVKQ